MEKCVFSFLSILLLIIVVAVAVPCSLGYCSHFWPENFVILFSPRRGASVNDRDTGGSLARFIKTHGDAKAEQPRRPGTSKWIENCSSVSIRSNLGNKFWLLR